MEAVFWLIGVVLVVFVISAPFWGGDDHDGSGYQ